MGSAYERRRRWLADHPERAAEYAARRSARSRAATQARISANRPPGRWLPIPGFDGYHVDANGRVLGLRGTILSPSFVDGYARVKLAGRKRVMVHRLVLLTFVGPCPPDHEVNHKNGRKGDNRRSNLEYITRSDNVRHSLAVLGRIRAPGEANGSARLTEEEVMAMRAMYDAGGITTREVARAFGIDRSHARRICTRQSWRHV